MSEKEESLGQTPVGTPSRSVLIAFALVTVVLVAAIAGVWYVQQQRIDKLSGNLSNALEEENATRSELLSGISTLVAQNRKLEEEINTTRNWLLSNISALVVQNRNLQNQIDSLNASYDALEVHVKELEAKVNITVSPIFEFSGHGNETDYFDFTGGFLHLEMIWNASRVGPNAGRYLSVDLGKENWGWTYSMTNPPLSE